MLKGVNINKTIDDISILKNVNIEVSPSNITCLIGPSGSGKSTILSILSLLETATSGQINVANQSYSFNNDKIDKIDSSLYPMLTVVFQGLFLFPHLSNKENILLPLREQKKNTDKYQYIVNQLKIENILNKFPQQCSGGEKQKVAIARQLLLNPKFLLLDEVTSALDLESTYTVGELLKEQKEEGTGILLITHMINFAKNIGDDFYFLDKGIVVEKGSIEQLNIPQTERLKHFLDIYG